MVKKNSPSRKAGALNANEINPAIARTVLAQLLEQHAELNDTVAGLVCQVSDNPQTEDLAVAVEEAVNRVSAGDVYMNSGRRSGRYKEPEEAAGELLSEALQPYVDRLEKLLSTKEDGRALAMCQAIILALYRVQHGDSFSDLEEYAGDFLEESADWAARLWRTAGNGQKAADRKFDPNRTMPAEFVRQCVPEWDWLLSDD